MIEPDVGLELRSLSVRYAGHLALDQLSLVAPRGRVTGLIGPNGAGKTTTFNVCSGLVRPSAGTVHLGGEDITVWTGSRRARAGLGRTFQRVEVCSALSVRTNVEVAPIARSIGRSTRRHLVAPRNERRRVEASTTAALEACGIAHLADHPVGVLSTGQRRLVELARVLVGGFDILLLDEPSSGLDEEETDVFGRVVAAAVADRGVGVLLVEHDVDLVMQLCDRIVVLDFGRFLFEGTPGETQASELVRAAYLGGAISQGAE